MTTRPYCIHEESDNTFELWGTPSEVIDDPECFYADYVGTLIMHRREADKVINALNGDFHPLCPDAQDYASEESYVNATDAYARYMRDEAKRMEAHR